LTFFQIKRELVALLKPRKPKQVNFKMIHFVFKLTSFDLHGSKRATKAFLRILKEKTAPFAPRRRKQVNQLKTGLKNPFRRASDVARFHFCWRH